MIALLQRVTHAYVQIDGKEIGRIDAGLLVLVGVERGDSQKEADRLLERVLNYRVFCDDTGKMNINLKDHAGGLLLVPQFTLAADTTRGNRAGFSSAAPPEIGKHLFDYFVHQARHYHPKIATGIFGADMQVSLCNDGPVTFWLQVSPQTTDDSTIS